MSGPNQFTEQARSAIVAAVVDRDEKIPWVLRAAKRGELDGFDPKHGTPSATTVRDWCTLERRLRRREKIQDRGRPIAELVDDMQRRVLEACDHDLEVLCKAQPGDRDYTGLVRTLETVKRVTSSLGNATPSEQGEGEKPGKIPQSGVLEAVQAAAAAGRADNAEPTTTSTKDTQGGEPNGATQHTDQHAEQQDAERRHLLQEAEERAARATAANGARA